MFISGRFIPMDARNVWNVNEPVLDHEESILVTAEYIRREFDISPNDYFWQPFFNDRIADDDEKENEESSRLNVEESYRQQIEEWKRFKRPEFSKWFKKEVRNLVKSLDLNRKLLGRPSCSTERMNQDEYCDGELCSGSEVASALKSAIGTCPSNSPVAKKNPTDSSSVVKDRPSSTPSESSIKSFPNPKSERIYKYVEEVMECYQRQRGQYILDLVVPNVETYRTKVKVVKLAFEENALGIREKIGDSELHSFDVHIGKLSVHTNALVDDFMEQWKDCNLHYQAMRPIKKEMVEGCFDAEVLGVARDLAMEMVNALKKTKNYLFDCLNAVKDVYGVLCEIKQYMESSPVKKN